MDTQIQPSPNGVHPTAPDSEVKPAKATRRTFTPQQKLKVLQETDSLSSGELGAYLRRKGIYSSSLSAWRKNRMDGLLAVLEPKKRGTPAQPSETRRMAELERENQQLRSRLDQAEKVIDVQKKLCELFGSSPAQPASLK